MLWEGLVDTRLHRRAHRAASRRCATACASTRPSDAAADLRRARGRHRAGRALVRRTAHGADAVAVLPGPEPEQQRHRQERRADQPASGHRPDRQARRRPVLADRPAQRDGRARGRRPGQPAVGAPRPGQPRAPRRSRARCGAWPTCRPTPGKTAVEMFEAAADGEIKALWIACTNPAQSMPDQATVRARAASAPNSSWCRRPIADTATAAYADLLLPATTWGEKDGTVTNTERRISRVRAGRAGAGRGARTTGRSPSTSRGGWKRGCGRGAADAVPLRDARGGLERAPRNHARPRPRHHRPELCAARRTRPQQWPLPEGATRGPARACTRTASSPPPTAARASSTRAYAPLAEPRDARYPFALTTGRLRDQWHGMSRTGTLGRLFGHAAEPAVEHARRRTWRAAARDGDLVQRDARAAARSCCRCSASDAVRAGQAFIADALGRGVPVGRAAPARAGRRQRADHRRPSARSRSSPNSSTPRCKIAEGRAALAAAGRGLAAGRPGAARRASSCAR